MGGEVADEVADELSTRVSLWSTAARVGGGDTTATISWTTPAQGGGGGITGYVITPYLAGGPQPPRTFFSSASLRTQTLTGLPNGRVYTFREFKNATKGRLLIHFDRPIKRSHGPGVGVNRHTMIVQYGDHGVLRLLPAHPQAPPKVSGSGRWAIFRIDPRYLRRRDGLAHRLLGSTIHVTLKCDFLPDCRGYAVDGDHIRGRLPSGDDVEGGTFESWFTIPGKSTGQTP